MAVSFLQLLINSLIRIYNFLLLKLFPYIKLNTVQKLFSFLQLKKGKAVK